MFHFLSMHTDIWYCLLTPLWHVTYSYVSLLFYFVCFTVVLFRMFHYCFISYVSLLFYFICFTVVLFHMFHCCFISYVSLLFSTCSTFLVCCHLIKNIHYCTIHAYAVFLSCVMRDLFEWKRICTITFISVLSLERQLSREMGSHFPQ
jgi:hypothetical protein